MMNLDINNQSASVVTSFAIALLFTAWLSPAVQADIVVDPDMLGATDITDGTGAPLDPTTNGGVLTPSEIVVGFNGGGELLINNDDVPVAVISSNGSIGRNAGSTGEVTVSGGAWLAGAGLGNATLEVGNSGHGELTINNGGAVFGDYAEIASADGSTGEVIVTGPFSKWELALGLEVGNRGTGTLTVLHGGAVSSTFGLIGSNPGSLDETSEVLVSGVDSSGTPSSWSLSQVLAVGNNRHGRLTIADGGRVTSTADTTHSIASGPLGQLGEVIVDGIHADGTRSLLDLNGDLNVGHRSTGILTITDGGRVLTEDFARVGGEGSSTGNGLVLISGKHANGTPSSWEIDDALRVGDVGTGKVTVAAGAQLSSSTGVLGVGAAARGEVEVTGPESTWTIGPGGLSVGASGTAKLTVTNGGTLTSVLDAFIGRSSMAELAAEVEITGAGSNWQISSGGVSLGTDSRATLLVADGGLLTHTGVALIGEKALGNGAATVTGLNSHWDITNNSDLNVGALGKGKLTIADRGRVTNRIGRIADGDSSDGSEVIVTGAGSIWENADNLLVGNQGNGKLTIENGGTVTTEGIGFVARQLGSTSEAVVTGEGSTWDVTAQLDVGAGGNGTLTVAEGGRVMAYQVNIANFNASCVGLATVGGQGATLEALGDLNVGGSGVGTLAIQTGGLAIAGQDVEVAGTVNMQGGTLQVGGNIRFIPGATLNFLFGTIHASGDRTLDGLNPANDLDGVIDTIGGELSSGQRLQIDGQLNLFRALELDGGELSAASIPNTAILDFNQGLLELTMVDVVVTVGGQFGDTLVLDTGQHLNVHQTFGVGAGGRLELAGGRLGAGQLVNAGVVIGNGRIDGPLNNAVTGEVRVDPGENLRFTGTGNTNRGDINLLGDNSGLGARVQFEQTLTNTATGKISGRGTLIANGGLTNQGEMRFLGGSADVHGNVSQTAGAVVRLESGAVVTFFDDFAHNGAAVQISDTSEVVFLGAVTGASSFTGPGSITFSNLYSPSNSPGGVGFGGDVVFTATSTYQVELAEDSFDHIAIAGDVLLDGMLDVDLVGFTPALGQSWEILDVDGTLDGTFAGLPQAALVGNFGGVGLFVDYTGGDGNDVVLFTGGLPGDFNGDGKVDGVDFIVWQRNTSVGNLSDWQNNHGTSLVANSLAVPEPSGTLLFTASLLVTMGSRIRNSNRL